MQTGNFMSPFTRVKCAIILGLLLLAYNADAQTSKLKNAEIKGYIYKTSEGKVNVTLVARSLNKGTKLRMPSNGYIFTYDNPSRSRIGDLLHVSNVSYDVSKDKWVVILQSNFASIESESKLPRKMTVGIIEGEGKINVPVTVDLILSKPPKISEP
jgi:hypothetical protein